MSVIKRTGTIQIYSQKKIINFLTKLSHLSPKLNNISLTHVDKVISNGMPSKINADDMLKYISSCCASMSTKSYDYAMLAGRVETVLLYRSTPETFKEAMESIQDILEETFLKKIRSYDYDQHINPTRDYSYDIIGIRTLERSYLLKNEQGFVERPQYLLMRVSVFLSDTPEEAIQTYEALSKKLYTHATPTLFHCGMKKHQLASCFLMTMKEDSVDGIFDSIHHTARISKNAGGIGISVSNIRAKGTLIKGTNGTSSGLVPMLRVFNNTARYIDQCVLPDTYVYTEKGPLQIQHLVDNDCIIHQHGIEQTKVLEHPYNGDILKFKTLQSVEDLTITPEHPLYILKDLGKSYNYNEVKKRISNGTNIPSWVDAKDVKERDFIAYPIPDYVKDVYELTPDDCYFYGLVLGDGSLQQNKSYGKVTLHSIEKKPIIEWLVHYFNKKYVKYTILEDGNTTTVRWNKSLSIPINYGDVYQNKEKTLHSKWLHLPLEKAKMILKGLIDTDGCKGKELQFDSTSRNLIESVRYICLRMGVLTSGQIRDRRGQTHQTARGPNKKISYSLRIPKVKTICDLVGIPKGKFQKFFEHDGMLYTRVQSIEAETYSGTLYDLQMKKDHSYITHNGLVHNGGGKRKGSFAIFIEPWHADIQDVLKLKLNHGVEEERARDLFYGLWIPDLFMLRVEKDQMWSLFCPTKVPGLQDAYGTEFNRIYEEAEQKGMYLKQIPARQLWNQICDTQVETGTPYMCYKNAANTKSNQQNLGTIRSSNLCVEVMEYSSPKETAVCTLASICLPECVGKVFDFKKLESIVELVTKNLNKVVDKTTYPVKEAMASNNPNRPVGIGVQGLADVFQILGIDYESTEAKTLNNDIFETIYWSALKTSMELSKKDGPYANFSGSPASDGQLQFDLWGKTPNRYDWDLLKKEIKQHGLRNSLLIACMPTASTAQINGNTESFEPRTSNLYVRRVLSGEFVIVNKYLENACRKMNQWTPTLIDNIMKHKGSIQNTDLPKEMKNIFKTVWEMSNKTLIDLSVGRAPYICQSQSLNLYVPSPNRNILSSMHFYAWKQGLKTGMYYLRTQPKANAIQFTVEECMDCSA